MARHWVRFHADREAGGIACGNVDGLAVHPRVIRAAVVHPAMDGRVAVVMAVEGHAVACSDSKTDATAKDQSNGEKRQ